MRAVRIVSCIGGPTARALVRVHELLSVARVWRCGRQSVADAGRVVMSKSQHGPWQFFVCMALMHVMCAGGA